MQTPLLGDFDRSVMETMVLLRTPALDQVTHFLLGSDLRIGVLAVLLFYLWLKPSGTPAGNEEHILKSLAAIVLAMVACFIARHLAPLQPRPRLSMAQLGFPPLDGLGHLVDIRSFPSDTATLAAALTMVIVLASRRLGSVAIAWALLAVSFPRLYVGYHYLSDIVAGLLLGGTVAWLVMSSRWTLPRATAAVRARLAAQPAMAMLLLALVAHQVGTMFPALQLIGGSARSYLKGPAPGPGTDAEAATPPSKH